MSGSGPLEGLLVIECSGYLSAPTAGYMLSDLGAQVIKVEDREKGDPSRGTEAIFGSAMSMANGENLLFETANRGKKAITLDLKKDKGKKILYDLVAKADVFCTNFTQKTIKNLNIDYDTLKQYNPKLVYGVATAYGLVGPEKTRGPLTALPRPDRALCMPWVVNLVLHQRRSEDLSSIR